MSHSTWFSHHFHRAAGGDEALTVSRISLWLEKRVHSLFILHSCRTIRSAAPGLQRPQTGLPFSVKVTQHFSFPRNPLFGASRVTRENVSRFAAPASSLGGLCPQQKHGFCLDGCVWNPPSHGLGSVVPAVSRRCANLHIVHEQLFKAQTCLNSP